MTTNQTANGKPPARTLKQYRLPGIEREGIAQLSLLETALWPLQGGRLARQMFETSYSFATPLGRKTATVTVRSPLGMQSVDELILWGLLAASLTRPDAEPTLLATPYWMLRKLGLRVGGTQYAELRDSLLRLAITSYQNTGFYNPESQEREHVAFQFLSLLLPTVGGVGESVDNDRMWRIEWNPAFFRFCKSTGGTLHFDLDVYRTLTPASRRLFLKLKDRFWRSKRVFLSVDDLTVNGLGFSPQRPLFKRKFDLLNCLRELLDHHVIELGRGQTDAKDLFLKHSKGSYVVLLHEGEYFRRQIAERGIGQKNAIVDDPLYEPLRKVGVDEAAVRRLFKKHSRAQIQKWLRITDAAMHEKPRGFSGFKVSPAAFLIDGVQNNRTPPDWLYVHEKKREQQQWEIEHAATEEQLRPRYDKERREALNAYLRTSEGLDKFQRYFDSFAKFYEVHEPHRFMAAAHEATVARIERYDFRFPDYAVWALTHRFAATDAA